MIQVVTLSPAIDVTYELGSVKWGEANRVVTAYRRAGGKGGNVARVLRQLGPDVRLVCPLGGHSGQWYADQMTGYGVDLAKVEMSGEIRTCVTVVTPEGPTEFNEPAPGLNPAQWDTLLAEIIPSDITVVSGSFPKDCSTEAIDSFFSLLRQSRGTVIADTSGTALRAALKYSDFVAPNLAEARTICSTDSLAEVVARLGPARVLLSLGADGVLLIGDGAPRRWVPPAQWGNTTGAGDALVAGFAASLHRGVEWATRSAVAVAAASVRVGVAGECDLAALGQIEREIEESPYDAEVDR